ncbi:MAG: hypothetical protein D6732_10475 [Methanobacteriota archaeon]|nr:MAG: hypothetical protein D6732_10475 [Euryarchaeota archaeon]
MLHVVTNKVAALAFLNASVTILKNEWKVAKEYMSVKWKGFIEGIFGKEKPTKTKQIEDTMYTNSQVKTIEDAIRLAAKENAANTETEHEQEIQSGVDISPAC